jgi:hypothetical protein
MPLHDLTDFLKLSAALNIQLAAEGVGWGNILRIITNRMPMSRPEDRAILLHVFEYLNQAYALQRRRQGPPAILHPLRATALLAQVSEKPKLLDMLTELLHDKFEDLTVEALGPELYGLAEKKFQELLKRIDPASEWRLLERLVFLALRKPESYFHYVGRLLDRAAQIPDLVRIKLADRLDNTLDMHIVVDDFLQEVNFFQVVFQILYPPSGAGYKPPYEHPITPPLNGAERLYQLFKNAVLLSLIREKGAGPNDPAATKLFRALSLASMQESQRIALHIMAYHEMDIDRQRVLFMEVLCYAQEGGMAQITSPSNRHSLDGLFMRHFAHPDSQIRGKHLDSLYRDKGLMLQAAMALVVIFLNFIHTPDYWIRGISNRGVAAPEFEASADSQI